MIASLLENQRPFVPTVTQLANVEHLRDQCATLGKCLIVRTLTPIIYAGPGFSFTSKFQCGIWEIVDSYSYCHGNTERAAKGTSA